MLMIHDLKRIKEIKNSELFFFVVVVVVVVNVVVVFVFFKKLLFLFKTTFRIDLHAIRFFKFLS